jgi:hypothetical protein
MSLSLFKGANVMNPITPTIRLFTYQESPEAGLHIHGFILEHQNNYYHFHGSTHDTIYVFTESSICIYVLSINMRQGYMALNVYMTPEPDPINSIFLHSPHEIKETLGHKWESLSAIKIINLLKSCLI